MLYKFFIWERTDILYSLRIFSLSIRSWVDSSFLSASKKLCVTFWSSLFSEEWSAVFLIMVACFLFFFFPLAAFQIFSFFNFQKFYYYVSWSAFFCGVGEVILAAWFCRFLSLDKFRKFSAILSSSIFLSPASFSSTSKTVYRNVSCFAAVPQAPETLFYFQSPPSGVQSRSFPLCSPLGH